MRYLRHVLDRLKEPSTWAGLTALLILLGLSVEEAGKIVAAAAGVAAFVAVLLPERGVPAEVVAEAFHAYSDALVTDAAFGEGKARPRFSGEEKGPGNSRDAARHAVSVLLDR